MSTVNEILDDIVMRLPMEVFKRYGEPGVLRVMNRIYKATNRDMQVLEKSTTFQYAAGPPIVTTPFDLPSDWGKLFDIRDQNDDDLTYMDPDLFDITMNDTYTIRGSKIYFSSFDTANDIYTVWYYSQGLTLLIDSPVAGTSVSTPEWLNNHDFLFYAVVAELAGLNNAEALQYRTLKENLSRTHYDKQGSTPARTLPHHVKNPYIDDYEYPTTRRR
jgi:hypothetical protein